MAVIRHFCMIGGFALVTLGVFGVAPAKSAVTVLYSFCSQQNCVDGDGPDGRLIADRSGNLYGTTYFGGEVHTGCANSGGPCGTVFKLAPDGTETVLHTFVGSDGGNPRAGVIADSAGNLYGTTIAGGSADFGTVFKIAPDGTETVLHSFQGGSDGYAPSGALVVDKHGNLFGTTLWGGSSAECNGNNYGCGTVFEVKSDGEERILYAFQGGADGGLPIAGLIARNGDFYGTTSAGGANCADITDGCGTIYRVSRDGAETVLYTFAGGSDGLAPWGALIADKYGDFYGTTSLGGGGAGCGDGCGTIFKLSSDRTESVLYAFQGGSDGESPYAALVADKAGNLYGTTTYGGGRGCKTGFCGGTVFKLAPDGSETVLHTFGAKRIGANPDSPLYMGQKGVLFGTASSGGPNHGGTVFRVRVRTPEHGAKRRIADDN